MNLWSEAAFCYLQPVMRAGSALLSVDALDLESVREVEADSETTFYSNNVLAGHTMRWGVRVSWTQQMSSWLVKNTTSAGYWARKKHLNLANENSHKYNKFTPKSKKK